MLPESSFIEIKNRSGLDYNLHNWKISNGSSTATIKTDFILKADSFLILCSTSSAPAFRQFGVTLGISGFPALGNDADDIILSSDAGVVIHALHYDRSWFDNEYESSRRLEPGNAGSFQPLFGNGKLGGAVYLLMEERPVKKTQ